MRSHMLQPTVGELSFRTHRAHSSWLGLRIGLPQPGKHPQPSLQPLKPQPILCPCFLLWPQPGFSEIALKRCISLGEVMLGGPKDKRKQHWGLLRKNCGHKEGKAFQIKNQTNLKIKWLQKMAVCSIFWASEVGKLHFYLCLIFFF